MDNGGTGDMRILLADDHAVVRAGIRNALKDLPDLEITAEVGDGPALFAALEQSHLDCLLIDVTMPDFDPVAAIRDIRVRYPAMRILVVSAYDDDVYVQGLLGVGVDGYHLKDQPLSDLQLAVQRVLAGERWISSPLLDKLVSYRNAPAVSPRLTTRQQELLNLLQQGLDNQAIAQQLDLSIKTVENHLTRLYRQLNVQSRLEAANYAVKHPEVLERSPQAGAVPANLPDTTVQKYVSILLVDDNARYRRQLRRMVSKFCPRAVVHEAQDIEEAVSLTERLAPDLALVDVVLDEEDGICCTRRLKALSPSSRIILISAYPDREFHRQGLAAGAVAFLDKKDLNTATLRQIVDDLIA
jgi:DNA-binding NarL/FixJ family response regulator